jgi:hypothetical protein
VNINLGVEKTATIFDLCEPEGQCRDVSGNAPFACFTVNIADGSRLNCSKATRRLARYSLGVLVQMEVFELHADTPHELPKPSNYSNC